ncbi:hypothetical protein [Lutibacter sp.]|uniref:hypothetical protein n=1 Tax=Lutibacter sp. TaxID=1925666 RepID=UPI0035682CFF
MKIFNKQIVFLLILLLSVGSCMEEIDVTEGQDPNTNNKDSETTTNYKRVGMHDGSDDDFIDETSCSSIKFPYSLSANNIPLTLSSIADYQLVKDIFNLSSIDVDTIVFNFPITIINQDYSETIITNLEALNSVTDTCNITILNNLNAITCVDIVYPIKISLFNLDTDQTTIISVENDEALFNFMNNLSENIVYSVQYPINVLSNTITSAISSDTDLKSIIDSCIN